MGGSLGKGLRAERRAHTDGLPRAPSRGGHGVSSGDTQSSPGGRCVGIKCRSLDTVKFRPLRGVPAGQPFTQPFTRASLPGGQNFYDFGKESEEVLPWDVIQGLVGSPDQNEQSLAQLGLGQDKILTLVV